MVSASEAYPSAGKGSKPVLRQQFLMIAESVSLQISRIHYMAVNKSILYSLDVRSSAETSIAWCN